MTSRTLIEELSHMLVDLLWFEMDRLDLLATVTTPICHISALGIECGFSFFPKGWDIDEIEVGGRHREMI
jgi:hypothetical protein